MADPKDIIIRVEHVSKLYGLNKSDAAKMMAAGADKGTVYKKTGCTVALWDINLEIPRGQIFVIIGLSGSGKSTMVRCFNRLNKPTSGKILFDGQNLAEMDSKQLLEFRRNKISMVFQSFGLMSHRDVMGNVAYGLEVKGIPKAEREAKAMQVISMVGLEGWEHQSCEQLSGGMRQRVGIARALANDPDVLLMDEPFSALDPMTRRTLQQEVRTLQQKLNKTFVFVTHDMAEALDLADVIIFMDHGRIVQMAPPEEMLSHPASGQIQDFLGKFIDLQAHKELTAADFMRTGVYTVSTRKGINECISKMQRHNVDTLIVVDDQARYQGTVSIADIRLTGHVVQTIEPLIRCNTPTVHAEDNAKDCFDQLISSGAPYLVVLDGQGQVAGIITKTSMASAMAEQLWG